MTEHTAEDVHDSRADERGNSNPASSVDQAEPFSRLTWWWVTALFVLASFLAIAAVWVAIESLTVLTAETEPRPSFDFLTWEGELGPDAVILLLAMSAGVVGGLIHFITSLAKYAGTKEFKRRWTVWYLARPLLGGLLAVLLYLLVRAGLIPSASGSDEISPYGVAALAGLAGMFSKQAIDWLERLFNTAFARAESLPDNLDSKDAGQ